MGKSAENQTRGGIKVFLPLVQREDAAIHETVDLVQRFYKGSVSMMMNAITPKQRLSKEEIEELYAILRQAEEAD